MRDKVDVQRDTQHRPPDIRYNISYLDKGEYRTLRGLSLSDLLTLRTLVDSETLWRSLLEALDDTLA